MITPAQQAANRWHVDHVNPLLAEFAAHMTAADMSPETIRTRLSILSTLAATTPLASATVHDLRLFLGRPDLAPSTRRSYRAIIAAFYRWLQADNIRPDNPADRLPRVRVPRTTPRPLTRQQITAMLTTGAYRRTRIMIMLGYFQGLRVSQIARVRGQDFDAGRMRTVGKGDVEHVMPVHRALTRIIPTMPDDWWFPARGGRHGHVTSRSVSDLIHDAIRRAGITDPHLTAHSLRHSYGTHLVEHGVDIRIISELMGHASVATTQIYTAVPDRLRRAGVDALPSIPIPAHSGRAA